MMIYLLQVSLCWILFYIFYRAFLCRETFFKYNRCYLTLSLAVGLVIPLLGDLLFQVPYSGVFYEASYQIVSTLDSQMVTEPIMPRDMVWGNLLMWLYGSVALALFARFCYGFIKLYRIYHRAYPKDYKGRKIYIIPDRSMIFSFFNGIFMSRDKLLDNSIDAIIAHEEVHCRQWHSLDIIWADLLQIFFWFNPIIYLYKKSIQQVHEYLADAEVIQNKDKDTYVQLLVNYSLDQKQFSMVHGLNHSQIKNRLIMMYRKKSSKKSLLKYLWVIPMALVVFWACSNDDSNSIIKEKVKTRQEENGTVIKEVPVEEQTEFADQTMEEETIVEDAPSPPPPQRVLGNIYKIVDQMPRFPGCEDESKSVKEKKLCADKKMLRYIYENIHYPAKARKNGTQGQVVISFVVEKDGSVSDIKILRDKGDGLGEESLRIVKSFNQMPNRWIPGKHNGEAVRVRYNLPIRFKLN